MKLLIVILTLSAVLFGQSATTTTQTPSTTPTSSASSIIPAASVSCVFCPQYTIGAGPVWTRGAANPFALDTTFSIRISNTKWYSYTTASTPFSTLSPGAPPVSSSITTGGGFIAGQSSDGRVSLVLIVQAGFTMGQTTTNVAPSFTGSFAVPIRVRKTGNLFVMPFAKLSNASTTATSGALATVIFQPGVQVMYAFGK